MNKIAIIGYGRFGALLCELLRTDYEIAVVEKNSSRQSQALERSLKLIQLEDIGSFDTVIFAVPISLFESVVVNAAAYISEGCLVMDICSVKVYPANVMQKHLPQANLIATHPMFGPDSASKGMNGLRVAVCPLTADDALTNEVAALWKKLGTEVIVTTPEEHDRDAVLSQAFTYSVAKIILGMDLSGVELTTRSFNNIAEVAKLSANDSDQLFHDMLFYNPYFQSMKSELTESMRALTDRLNEIEKEQIETGLFTNRG